VSGLNNAVKHIGTSWVTLFLSMNTLSIGKKFYLLDGNNFLSESKPAGEARWYDSFEVHGINYFLIAQEFRDFFEKKSLSEHARK
jgi:hypothetical protein